MALVFKLLEKDLIEKVLQFFNSERGIKQNSLKRTRREFEWLFLEGNYERAIYAVALDSDSDEIIGIHAGIFIPMASCEGKKTLTMKGEDTLISFDRVIRYGRRDILREIYSFLENYAVKKNVSFLWGFSPAKAAFKRTGCQVSDPVLNSFLVLKPFDFYSQRIKLILPVTLKRKITIFSFAVINYLIQRTRSISGSHFNCRKVDFSDVHFEKLLEFIPKDVYSLWLDKEFLTWRIQRNPSDVKYCFCEFKNNENEIIAYLIYSEKSDRTIYIEQFLFNGLLSRAEKLDAVNTAKRFFRGTDAVMIRAMGFSHNLINIEEVSLLKRTGFHFFASKEPSYFLIKDLSGSGISLEKIYVSRLNLQGVV